MFPPASLSYPPPPLPTHTRLPPPAHTQLRAELEALKAARDALDVDKADLQARLGQTEGSLGDVNKKLGETEVGRRGERITSAECVFWGVCMFVRRLPAAACTP